MAKHLLLAAVGATLMGCSTVKQPCSSLQCISLRAQQPVVRECVRDLQFYAVHRAKRRAIDRKYRYPLTNADSYAAMSRMGAVGPSPRDWCEAYAARQARVVLPASP